MMVRGGCIWMICWVHSAFGGGPNSPQAGGALCLFCFKKKKKKKMLVNEVGVSSIKASLDIPWWRFYGLRAIDNFLGSIFPRAPAALRCWYNLNPQETHDKSGSFQSDLQWGECLSRFGILCSVSRASSWGHPICHSKQMIINCLEIMESEPR